MSDEKKEASEEERQKLIELLEEGKVEISPHGREYFQRAGKIDSVKPDFTLVKVEAAFWGPWEQAGYSSKGGVELSWQTVSAGFGGLTLSLGPNGEFRVDNEGMSKEFCREVLLKWFDSIPAEKFR